MSAKSYFRRMGIGKQHRYETQADLQDMTREEIVRIDPKDIGLYIETETGDRSGVPEEIKNSAELFSLFLRRDILSILGK